MNTRHIRDLEAELDRIAVLAAAPEDRLQRVADRVSAWSVSQQLDHILKVANATLGAVARAKPLDDVAGINFVGRAVALAGWIPRGRARAPERLHGVAVPSNELLDQLANARGLLAQIADSAFEPAPIPVVRHPIFRGLTPIQTLRFVVVHTRHHLKIVRDINR